MKVTRLQTQQNQCGLNNLPNLTLYIYLPTLINVLRLSGFSKTSDSTTGAFCLRHVYAAITPENRKAYNFLEIGQLNTSLLFIGF